MSLSLRQLRAFLAVADAESFTGAAEQLNLTQSAVSMLIRQLEADLNIALFVRSGRGAHLTEFGTSIRPTAKRVLSDVQNINDAAADLRSLQRGHLRIAVPQVLGSCWLPTVLGAFRQQFPDVEVSISETAGDGVTDLVGRGDAEIGIGPERPLASGVVADVMWDVPMQLVVSRHAPQLRNNKSPTPRELEKMQWINYSDDFSALLHRTLLGNPDTPRTQDIRVMGLMSAMAIIGQENYVTVAPAYAGIFADVFGVRFIALSGPASKRRFLQFVRAKHDLSPAAATFLDMARRSGPLGSTHEG